MNEIENCLGFHISGYIAYKVYIQNNKFIS
jgi:hypothetical protein